MIHIVDVKNGSKLFDALNSNVRIEILSILRANGEANLNQLAKSLNISNGAVTAHAKKLQDSNLISVHSRPGVRGSQKICKLTAEKIIVELFDDVASLKDVYSFDVGIGHYVDYSIKPTCGLATETSVIGEFDDPKYFSFPERIGAGLLWFAQGYVAYKLPNSLKAPEVCTELQISMEISSEAPGFSDNYPSDISFKINGIPLGFFTIPGEFNDRRGIFTPSWWFENLGQYGKLKLLTIKDSGCYMDGLRIHDTTIGDLNITPRSDIIFSIESREDAAVKGGVTLFGKGFGDFNSGITVKMFYAGSEGVPPA
ncbi:MAG: winged helix-turn-helix transcriptional regulator [Defluviitaleaceae bacterium]|nr:winged helix-turn-helix transcriptional regulator [Defluviitaleaceae bacterium]MCL2836874.1 winged helix-turn-helix transcriptional regulator [Defluviitaleaceae bacterium]